jgi:carotenoid cleavage dioxygenase-like enzyme
MSIKKVGGTVLPPPEARRAESTERTREAKTPGIAEPPSYFANAPERATPVNLTYDNALPADLPAGDVYRVLPGGLQYREEFSATTAPGEAPRTIRGAQSPIDGHGLVMRLHISEDASGQRQMTYLARYVDSLFRQIEEREGRGIFQSYSFLPDLSALWQDPKKWLTAVLGSLMSKGTYNTGVLPMGDRVIPIVEDHAAAYALDRETLETVERNNALPGVPGIGPKTFALTNQTVTAHPKLDSASGKTFLHGVVPAEAPFMGMRLGSIENGVYTHGAFVRPSRASLVLPENLPLPTGARQALEKVGARFGEGLGLDYFPQPHELALAGDHLVIPFLPIRVNMKNMAEAGAEDALSWRPEMPTELVFVNKNGFSETARVEINPPLAAFHWPWGRQIDDRTVELVTIVHDDLEGALGDGLEHAMARGDNGVNIGGRLVKLTVDLKDRTSKQTVLSDVPVELPTTDRRYEGNDSNHVFCVASTNGGRYMNAIHAYDVTQPAGSNVTAYTFPEGHIVSEPTFVPAEGKDRGTDGDAAGYLVSVVHVTPQAGQPARAYVAIFDARDVAKGPVSSLPLPDAVGFGLHTAFAPAAPPSP